MKKENRIPMVGKIVLLNAAGQPEILGRLEEVSRVRLVLFKPFIRTDDNLEPLTDEETGPNVVLESPTNVLIREVLADSPTGKQYRKLISPIVMHGHNCEKIPPTSTPHFPPRRRHAI